jgi:hypothetical protein
MSTTTHDTINTDGMTNKELEALGVTLPKAKRHVQMPILELSGLVTITRNDEGKPFLGLMGIDSDFIKLRDYPRYVFEERVLKGTINRVQGHFVFVRLPHNVKADVYQSIDSMPAVKLFDGIPLGRGMFYQLDSLDVDRIEWGEPLMVSQVLAAGIGGITYDEGIVWAEMSKPMTIDWRSIYIMC